MGVNGNMKRPIYLLFSVDPQSPNSGIKHLIAIYKKLEDAEKEKEAIESVKIRNIGHAVCKIEKWFFAEE